MPGVGIARSVRHLFNTDGLEKASEQNTIMQYSPYIIAIEDADMDECGISDPCFDACQDMGVMEHGMDHCLGLRWKSIEDLIMSNYNNTPGVVRNSNVKGGGGSGSGSNSAAIVRNSNVKGGSGSGSGSNGAASYRGKPSPVFVIPV